jgi:hypothetical protein
LKISSFFEYNRVFKKILKFVDFETWRKNIIACDEADKKKKAEAAEAAAAIAASHTSIEDASSNRWSGLPTSTNQTRSSSSKLLNLTVPYKVLNGNVIELLELPRVCYKKVKVDNAFIYGGETKSRTVLLTLIKIDQSFYAHPYEVALLIGQPESNLVNLFPESYAECTQKFKCSQVTWEAFRNVCDQIGVDLNPKGELELLIYWRMGVLLKELLHPDVYPMVKAFLCKAIHLKKYTGESENQ